MPRLKVKVNQVLPPAAGVSTVVLGPAREGYDHGLALIDSIRLASTSAGQFRVGEVYEVSFELGGFEP